MSDKDNPYVLDSVEKVESEIKNNPNGWVARLCKRVVKQIKKEIDDAIMKEIEDGINEYGKRNTKNLDNPHRIKRMGK